MNDSSVEIVIRALNEAMPGIKSAIKDLERIKKEGEKLKDMPVGVKPDKSFNSIRDRLRGITDSVKKKIPIMFTARGLTGISKQIKDASASIGGAISKTAKWGAALSSIGVVASGIGYTLKAVSLGSDLQQQQISMRHFIGVSNKDLGDTELDKMTSDYMEQLQKNANYTPFGQGEVMQAGTRALSVADGDTKKAMEFVELAEDMAALNPGKTVMDAMEALADANVGEMERLKEFGFKMSADDFKNAGGNLFAMKDSKGRTLQSFYNGGAQKLSTSGAGLLSTITGNLESGLQAGGLKMLEAMMPTLQNMIPLSEQFASVLENIGNYLAGMITTVVNGFTQAGGVIDYCRGIIAQLTPLFNQISAWATANMPMIQAGFMTLVTAIDPVIATVIALIQTFWQMFETAWPILSRLGSVLIDVVVVAINMVCTGLQLAGKFFTMLGAIAMPVLAAIWMVLKPIVEALKYVGSTAGKWLLDKLGVKLDTGSNPPEPMSSGNTGGGLSVQQNNEVIVRSAEEAATFTAGALPGKYAAARG